MSRNVPLRARESVVLNPGGDEMSKKNRKRYHRNPNGALMREAGKTLLATAAGATVAVAGSIGAAKLTTDPRKHAALVGGGALALGVALHVNDMAPRVGKAIAAGGATIAVSELAAHYQIESRIRGLVGGTAAQEPCPTGQTRNAQGQCTATPAGYPLAGALPAGYPSPGIPRQAAGYPMAGARTR